MWDVVFGVQGLRLRVWAKGLGLKAWGLAWTLPSGFPRMQNR